MVHCVLQCAVAKLFEGKCRKTKFSVYSKIEQRILFLLLCSGGCILHFICSLEIQKYNKLA